MHLAHLPVPFSAGDCMPFFHDGVFHLFYLLDQDHHQSRGGLGCHQWAHASSTDLVHFTHHPLALPITEAWEGSICTGSVIDEDGLLHAFYATRRADWTQHLSHATSRDGIHFSKDPAPLAFPPAGCSKFHFRDPFVFRDGEARRLLVTTQLDPYPLADRGGCLLQLTSVDLRAWASNGPLLVPGVEAGYGSIPECADLFEWNGWYYLLYGLKLHTHYRMARSPDGPWLRPAVDTLDNRMLAVMKTAPFTNNRRIGAAWAPDRRDEKDSGDLLWGGSFVLRELAQLPDGSLGTRFVPEYSPAGLPLTEPAFQPLTGHACGGDRSVELSAANGLTAGMYTALPRDYFLRCRVILVNGTGFFGLGLRGEDGFASAAELRFQPWAGRVLLGAESIDGVEGIDLPFDLEVRVCGSLFEACINQERCILNNLPEQHGPNLVFFCEHGAVRFDRISIYPLALPEPITMNWLYE